MRKNTHSLRLCFAAVFVLLAIGCSDTFRQYRPDLAFASLGEVTIEESPSVQPGRPVVTVCKFSNIDRQARIFLRFRGEETPCREAADAIWQLSFGAENGSDVIVLRDQRSDPVDWRLFPASSPGCTPVFRGAPTVKSYQVNGDTIYVMGFDVLLNRNIEGESINVLLSSVAVAKSNIIYNGAAQVRVDH